MQILSEDSQNGVVKAEIAGSFGMRQVPCDNNQTTKELGRTTS